MVIRIQPSKVEGLLEQLTQEVMQMTLTTQGFKEVQYEILEKNTLKGEITARLIFEDASKVSSSMVNNRSFNVYRIKM
jgi:hypothetical protein